MTTRLDERLPVSDKIRATFHGARFLPVAAIPKGSVVRVESAPMRTTTLTIVAVHNADPVAGQIRWETAESEPLIMGAAEHVEIVSLP